MGNAPSVLASYLLAVAAAVANAASNILQRQANRQEPPELTMARS